MLLMNLSLIRCDEETDEVGDDEPYVLITSVLLTPPIQGGPPQAPLNSDVVLHAFENMSSDGRPRYVVLPPFWGIGGVPATLTDPDEAMFIVALMENDSGDPQLARMAVRTAVTATLASSLASPRQAKVTTLIADIGGTLRIPTGFPNFDESIGSPQELRFTTHELQRAENGERVTRNLTFAGDGGRYTLGFDAVRAGWRRFTNIGDRAFRAIPGAPIAIRAQADDSLVATVVGADGVPHISWQQPNAPWHDFVRIAAYDPRFPDGFTVPPEAPIELARQRDGTLVAAVTGRDGVPCISWQQPGAPWHLFERIAAYDPRFPDGFTVPPGAPIAVMADGSATLVATVVGRDGVPYISWQQVDAPWHSFERIAQYDSRFPDGFTVPPGAPTTLGLQQDDNFVVTAVVAVVGWDGVPYISWQQPGAAWHLFERIAAYDPRFVDGFTVPPGARIAMGRQHEGLVAAVVGRDGVPYITWQENNGAWHRFERIAAPDPRFPDGTLPPGAPMALGFQPNGKLLLTVVDHSGVPFWTSQNASGTWRPFERMVEHDPAFPDGFTVPPGALMAVASQPGDVMVAGVVGRDGVPYLSWWHWRP